jgi:hypothetical protein
MSKSITWLGQPAILYYLLQNTYGHTYNEAFLITRVKDVTYSLTLDAAPNLPQNAYTPLFLQIANTITLK